jgi:Cation transport ATPase
MEMKYKLTGLDCPNCVARMEKVIGKVPGVKSVSINFASGKTIIAYDGNEEEISKNAEAAVKKAEPKVVFVKA